ncbi:hypothetical protein ACAG39_09280 [Caldicellulosiruptoraceae bacterium PP1]
MIKEYVKPMIEEITEDELLAFEADALSCSFCKPICNFCGVNF